MRYTVSPVLCGESAHLRYGDRVTAQHPRSFDGTPVAGWPDPHYVGTVLALECVHGIPYAVVKRDTLTTPHREPLDRLYLVNP
jgi:hypothetical protein